MAGVASVFRKTLKPLLFPHGYRLCKGCFVRETEDVFFVVHSIKKERMKWFDIEVDIVPYCADLRAHEYCFEEGYSIINLYDILYPDSLTPEHCQKFLAERLTAVDEGTVQKGMNAIRADFEDAILPYLHRFEDLDCCYDGLLGIKKARDAHRQAVDPTNYYKDYMMHGLSLKLHKYENALVFVETMLSFHKETVEGMQRKAIGYKKGDLTVDMPSGWSVETRERLAKSMLRKTPNYIEKYLPLLEVSIAEKHEKIKELETMREALLARDAVYVDKLVAETEASSREYMRELLDGKKAAK